MNIDSQHLDVTFFKKIELPFNNVAQIEVAASASHVTQCTQTVSVADSTLCAWRCWNQLAYLWLQSGFGKTSGFEVMIFTFDPSRKQN